MPVRLSVIALLVALTACSDSQTLPLNVYLGGRTVSKLPFVIALDQGLYSKYGLDIDMRLPEPTNDSARRTHATHFLARSMRWLQRKAGKPSWQPDVYVDGHTPSLVKFIDRANFPHRVAIAGIDCWARAHIVAKPGIDSLEQLKNARIGISGRRDTTTGFMAQLFAKRMGWDPLMDISIKLDGRNLIDIDEDRVDAIIASETRFAQTLRGDYSVLADIREWNVALGGNSALVEAGWLDDQQHREAARRFLQATVEGLALFHENRELALDVIRRWYGIADPREAAVIYERGQWLERTPYPCHDGIDNTFEMYDSSEMRKHQASDFYDDSILRELDRSGFIKRVYAEQ